MKRTKSIMLFVLALCMLFAIAACGGGEAKEVKPVAEIYADITAKVTLPELLELNAAETLDYVGIPETAYTEGVALIPADAVLGDMLFIYHAADKDSLETIKAKLTNFRTQKLNEMNNYIPAEYDKINASEIQTAGDYIWLVVSDDAATILETIESAIK